LTSTLKYSESVRVWLIFAIAEGVMFIVHVGALGCLSLQLNA